MFKLRYLLRIKPPGLSIINRVQIKSFANSTEQEYLVRLRQDPDIFGTPEVKQEVDADDLKEDELISNPRSYTKSLSTKQYANLIKDLLNKRKIKEAIDLVEIKMIKEDGVKPENYIYNLILGACGRVGYTKKAFSMYNDMKRRGLKIHPGTYTALFNACANCPFIEEGLSRTKHLHNIMIEKRYEPNDSNYNAMIKAYGRCGDLSSAFALVDQMIENKYIIKDDTLNFLLQACITDTEAGFRHALLVWRKFIDKNIQPSIYSYNLMLRCIRDCGMGDLEITKNVIERLVTNGNQLLLNPGSEVVNRPNLMAKVPQLGDIISLSEINKPEDRLLLVGGASNFLINMAENNCKPDIKTFMQLIDCVPNTLVAEKELILAMKKNNLKPDLDFLNMLIKKRSMRSDYKGAEAVLEMIAKARFQPNLMTYGVLALGCKTKEQAESLLQEMQGANYRLNAEILGAMLRQACYHRNFPYILFIMDLCTKENISPNAKFIEHLETFQKKCKDETNLNTNKSFLKGYEVFKMQYKNWREVVTLEKEPHPWQQFNQKTETNLKHYKDKEVKFKPRHDSYFKVKLGANVSNKKKLSKIKRNDL